MRLSYRFILLSALISLKAWAQSPALDPDWQESQVATPPTFQVKGLLLLDMPRYVSIKIGVDPTTVSIGPDGVVRYVAVAANSSGTVNAMYEGIRCATGEVKVYARYGMSGQWTMLEDPQWTPLNDNQPSRHALAFARQGACDGRAATATTVDQIIRLLKNPGTAGR